MKLINLFKNNGVAFEMEGGATTGRLIKLPRNPSEIKKGNELRVVTYFNDSSSGRTNPAYNMSRLDDTSETGQLQSTNLDNSVANPLRMSIVIDNLEIWA